MMTDRRAVGAGHGAQPQARREGVDLGLDTIKLLFSRKVHKISRTRELCLWISNFTQILNPELLAAFTMADDWIRPCASPA